VPIVVYLKIVYKMRNGSNSNCMIEPISYYCNLCLGLGEFWDKVEDFGLSRLQGHC